MTGRLDGKVAVITGSGGSIGRAACLRFAREGARLVGCDSHSSSALETVKLVEAGGGVMHSLHEDCDLTRSADAQSVVDLALSVYGRIDILYNNAAMAYFNWFSDLTFDEFRRTQSEEVDLVFHLCKAAWPHLIAQRSGSIINTSSVSGMICYEVLPGLAHSTAKSAILGLTRHLAMEGAQFGVRANAVSPGLIKTQQTESFLSDPVWGGKMRNKIMLERVGEPEDVAAVALFLASDDAAWVTGINLPVDGGTTAW
jgi:NAD(P)-dependent dehydrogenase (short-subunit alcohol dehydrogenase family)